MAIYLEIEGIEGNITAKGYEKMIEVSSFNWGVGRAISQNAGRMANREASRPSISEITLTKVVKQHHYLFKSQLSALRVRRFLFTSLQPVVIS